MLAFLRNIFHKERLDHDLDQEIRGYLDLISAEKVRNGMVPEDAAREGEIGIRMALGFIQDPHNTPGLPRRAWTARVGLAGRSSPSAAVCRGLSRLYDSKLQSVCHRPNERIAPRMTSPLTNPCGEDRPTILSVSGKTKCIRLLTRGRLAIGLFGYILITRN